CVVERIEACQLPNDFAVLIEGPVDSLDGEDFDPSRDSDADRLVVQRLAELARRLHARAVNIHLIAPSTDLGRLTLDCRKALLKQSVRLVREFVNRMAEANAVPTLENMPPVLRMRRSDFAFTPIGMASADLLWMAERVPGVRLMVDTSHAGLYLNAHTAERIDEPWGERLRGYLRQLPQEPPDVLGYAQALQPYLSNAQIANARGVLGEGLPYEEGDLHLDPIIAWLGEHVEHIVTETIEANHDEAVFMRGALKHMRAVLV
ncbi:MAG TPA: hypothetical protein VFG86_10515, partial [Chloroflexota bacterium]|nr:hypothetical protein [Chloroflexota bacterium]